MSYQVRYSVFARRDTEKILDDLSRYSVSAPDRFADRLEEQVERIKEMPYLYEEYRFAPKYRRMVIDKYVVLYQVLEEEQAILVYRVLHGAQNILQYL